MECYIQISDYAISHLLGLSTNFKDYADEVKDNITTYKDLEQGRRALKIIFQEIAKASEHNDNIIFFDDVITWNGIRIELINEKY